MGGVRIRMISAPFSLVASFIGNVRFFCPSCFEMYAGVIRQFLDMSMGIPWSRMQAEARSVFLWSYHSLSRSKLLSRHIRNWSLTPNSTDSFLLMDDNWQCVPCHGPGLWLSVSHAANESSFVVIDNTYFILWPCGSGAWEGLTWASQPPCLSMLQSECEPRLLLSQTQLPGWTPCLLEVPTSRTFDLDFRWSLAVTQGYLCLSSHTW